MNAFSVKPLQEKSDHHPTARKASCNFGLSQTAWLPSEVTRYAMGTVMTHKAYGGHAGQCLTAVCEHIDYLEQLLSRFLPESDISRINESAGTRSVSVSSETLEVLVKSVEFAHLCSGCFDITIAPLVSLWNRAKGAAIAPDAGSIEQVLPLVNYQDILLDPRESTAGLRFKGQSVDLGGIGKGFAADRILEIYRNYGITSACSNLGGNVITLGAKPDGTPWQVGIQHPRHETRLLGSVAVMGQAVVTSGDYQRYFSDEQGKRHHHILDPKTGYPSDSGLVSVTIVTENSLVADALSTILFVAGMQRGVEYLRDFPQSEAIFVDTDLRVFITAGLKNCFQPERGMNVTVIQ